MKLSRFPPVKKVTQVKRKHSQGSPRKVSGLWEPRGRVRVMDGRYNAEAPRRRTQPQMKTAIIAKVLPA